MMTQNNDETSAVATDLLKSAVATTETLPDAAAALMSAAAQALALQFGSREASVKFAEIAADGLALTIGRAEAAAYLRELIIDVVSAARTGAAQGGNA